MRPSVCLPAQGQAIRQTIERTASHEDSAHLFKIAQERKIAEDRIAEEEKAEAAAELAQADAVAEQEAWLAAEESAANAGTRAQKLLDEVCCGPIRSAGEYRSLGARQISIDLDRVENMGAALVAGSFRRCEGNGRDTCTVVPLLV